MGTSIIAILIFQKTNQPSIALSQEWTATQVTDGDSITVRQTDGSQMEVELCGINAPEVRHDKATGQPFGNKAKQKLRSLVATNDSQVMVIPVGKDEQGRTVGEVMVYAQGEAEISFQEELLKSGLARTQQGEVECPNQIAFENAQRLAIASKAGIWGQMK
uniref:Thermonuclease family protein n=1 Tax=Desmonostoc muscorum LEGE 12446 TaxID=1828758 RepID=A0A8J7A0S8_DESMC